MMDWERGNKIIVYCSRKTGRTCSGGSPVIPHEHPREVYVKSAKANDRWVIVKALTTESDKLCYYLIDKSFNIKSRTSREVSGCLDLFPPFATRTSHPGYFLFLYLPGKF